MLLENIIKAILIGLGASIPLGPVGILCIQRTLSKGRWAGLSVGLGASLGDTIYASAALFSVALISGFLDANRVWVMLFGGLIVFVIGLQIAIKNPIKEIRQPKRSGDRHVQDVLRGFIITVTNPGALVLMIGLFAFFGLDITDNYQPYAVSLILAAIFAGTMVWWFILSSTVSAFRRRFRLRQLIAVNRISGTVIAVIGVAAVLEGLFQKFIVG